MEKDQAAFLANLIEQSNSSIYEVQKLETVSGTLPKFHQWTSGKKVLAGFEVIRPETETGYYFLLIDWHRNDVYYLVIYAHDKSTTVAELRQVQEIDGLPQFVWMYKPFKRDGKNHQRKAYFMQMFGSTTVQIKLPGITAELDEFFTQMFRLCQNRIKADRIVEIFDLEK